SKRTAAARPGGGAPNSGSGFSQRERSSAVNTRTTPGMAAAASVRMPRIRAWAWGGRTKAACSRPGSVTSSKKRPSPRRNLGSSRRLTAAPKYFADTSGLRLGLVLGGNDPVEPGRGHGHEQAGDGDPGDHAHDPEEHERDGHDERVEQEVHLVDL